MADLDELPRSLALARAGLLAPDGARERVRARLGSSLAPATAGPSRAGAAGGSVPSRLLAGATRARAWTAGLMALSFAAGYWLRGEQVSSPSAAPALAEPRQGAAEHAVPAARPLPAPPVRATPPAAPVPLESASAVGAGQRASRNERGSRAARSVEAKNPPRVAAPPEADGLAREVALLQRVERAIRAEEGELALALLQEHEQSYPASTLREERAAARVLAACVARQGSEPSARARADAQRYLGERASSVYADRVRTLCQIELDGVEERGTKKLRVQDTDVLEGASP